MGKVASASDKTGGELKFIGTQDADSWDPQRGYYGFMWDFARYYTRTLVTPPSPHRARTAPRSWRTWPPTPARSRPTRRPTPSSCAKA
ncbi:hypothetical protein GCM10020000_24290 [Streptomyces olivoverticillatus]